MNIVRLTHPSEDEVNIVRSLFTAYQKELGLDLCFQGFEEELNKLPGIYVEPQGCILLAKYEDQYCGVVALKPLDKDTCEMKRLYVSPEYRKHKIGKYLVKEIIQIGRQKGYKEMKLDTLERLTPAIRLYEMEGFKKTIPYNYNPDKTVVYYNLTL